VNNGGTSAESSIESGLATFFRDHPESARSGIIVAFSGGIDSSVLLAALTSMAAKASKAAEANRGLSPFRAVHVVHNLRDPEELRRERSLVRDSCRKLGVPLTIAVIKAGSVERVAFEKGIGEEAAACELRYGILKREARRFGIGTICTAHNADDQLETMIGRFLSSSSIDGLAGIPQLRTIGEKLLLARPLLFASRKQIENYAAEKNLVFSTDSSNASTEFFRNRIRHCLVPILESEFPGWRKGILGTREKLGLDKVEIGENFERAMLSCTIDRSQKEAHFPFATFMESSDSLRIRILAACIGAVSGGERLSFKALRNASISLASGAKRLDVLGARLLLDNGQLSILSILDFKREDGYFFQVESEGTYRAGDVVVSLCWAAPGGHKSRQTKAPEKGKGYL
ncbi:MAG TPA: tRNA lysidine(34) synthetase TilS, partial [Rectinemataceae bacterium]|nr:tRNA lysidine(34) synthetase TilS [Rectinemataceae bacterium]